MMGRQTGDQSQLDNLNTIDPHLYTRLFRQTKQGVRRAVRMALHAKARQSMIETT